MVDITADSTVYPSANDIAETEKEGRFATEQRHTDYIDKGLMENHIVSGFTVPASDPDLTIPVALGEAFIDGHRIEVSTSTDVTVVDAATNHIYLVFGVDGAGDADTVDIVVNQTGIAPIRSVKLFEADAAAGAITATRDSRSFNAIKAGSVRGLALNALIKTFSVALYTIPATIGTVITGVTIAIPIGFFERQTTPKVKIILSGDVLVDATGPRTPTFTIRLNTVIQKTSIFGPLATSDRVNIGMLEILTLDPTIVNTIDVTAQKGGPATGTTTLREFRMFIEEIGETERL